MLQPSVSSFPRVTYTSALYPNLLVLQLVLHAEDHHIVYHRPSPLPYSHCREQQQSQVAQLICMEEPYMQRVSTNQYGNVHGLIQTRSATFVRKAYCTTLLQP